MCWFFLRRRVGMRLALLGCAMKHLVKTIALVSMASLFAMSSSADAKKRSRKHKSKQVSVEKDIPWYEQDIAPAKSPAKKAPQKATTTEKKPAPSVFRIGTRGRKSVQPSGHCAAGCDKSARKMSMSKFEIAPDDQKTKASRAAARAKAIKAAKAAKARAAKKKVASSES